MQIGPLGVSTSVPWAPGFSATSANTTNGLGLASPFATTNSYLNNLGMNSFGQDNPYTPLIGTPYDMNFNHVLATGAFGGYQNPMSPYTGMAGLPLPDGSFGFGGPGGDQAGSLLNGNLGGLGGLGGGGGLVPELGGALPGAAGAAAGGGGVGGTDLFGNPTLFGGVDPNVLPGLAQSFSHEGGDFANRFNLISDGISKLFLQGQADPNMPRQMWASGGTMRSPYGIYETGVGWAGGHANAGIFGTQASGMAWAMARNPINPGMITSYSNPMYNRYNWNEGFTNA